MGAVPALIIVFTLDLGLNSSQPLVAIIESRGWIYALAAGFVLLAYSQRNVWLESLDRRFFREQYNAQRVLRDVVDEIRETGSFERVAPRVVARIETALHPEYVSLLVRQVSELNYRVLTSFPSTPSGLFLTDNSKIVALLRALGKPLEGLVSNSDWFERQLPADELRHVRTARLDLLVPITVGPERQEAVLALGPKRSEEPYTRQDQELLEAIASSVALLLEQSTAFSQSSAEVFEECPECGVCYDVNSGTCSKDGVLLKRIHLPRTLVGRYRLERRRGRGGMGTVYAATDQALERPVAVKLIRDDWLGEGDAAQRFRREARAAASLTHPNVVTIYDYGVETGTRAFIVMELLEGVSLRQELFRCERLDPDRTLEIVRAVTAAVEVAHRRQLVHRDLKPENIFIATTSESGEAVKVLDFGLAKSVAPTDEDAQTVSIATDAGSLVGTLAYMSPEQLLGGGSALRWDLWALGVVAYECLTGAVPFRGATVSDLRNQILSGHFIPLDRHLANPPAGWQLFFARCFDRHPAKRPQSATEFFQDLERTLSESPSARAT